MFAIRQKSSGYWMPAFSGRAGGTYMEPKPDAIPRLFSRYQDAKAALDWWLRGRIVKSYHWETGEFEDFTKIPVEGRSAEDMEIIEVEIKELHNDTDT